MYNSVCPYRIEVKNFPDDMYIAVGKVIELAQAWEEEMKTLARLVGVPDGKSKSVEKFTLDRLCKALYAQKILDGRMFDNIEKIIQKRNEVNHTFFLDRERVQSPNFQEEMTEYFSEIATLINEVRDYIGNLISRKEEEGGNIAFEVPTIFDDGLVLE